jgi:hypothetical protein
MALNQVPKVMVVILLTKENGKKKKFEGKGFSKNFFVE